MRHFSHFNTARQILSLYRGEQPFGYFIKDYFKREKKYGSKDRKRISHLCYCFFRTGKIWQEKTIDDRILLGIYLTQHTPDELLKELKPGWNETISLPVIQKMEFLEEADSWIDIFPAIDLIDHRMPQQEFSISHLIQPDLFLRIRPGHKKKVIKKLLDHEINFQEIGEFALSLPNASKLEEIIEMNSEAVVQDLSSQCVGNLIKEIVELQSHQKKEFKVWDCCAASGGKSIMTYDIAGAVKLTVSDIRQSILVNLKKRFAEAGITNYKEYVIDLGKKSDQANRLLNNEKFDLVIADVPCTGSGTWGRTPEQLSFFKTTLIDEYAEKQRMIINNITPFIQQNGYLLYITCSVYRKENEENIQYISSLPGVELKRMELFQGYREKADTLFAALFQRIL